MTDYDMHDMIRDHAQRICNRLYVLDGAPERYDQRLTRAYQMVRDLAALLDECDG
jgi:bacterioferritin (cytochrome b1)